MLKWTLECSFIYLINIYQAFTVCWLWAHQGSWNVLPDLKEFTVLQDDLLFTTVYTLEDQVSSTKAGIELFGRQGEPLSGRFQEGLTWVGPERTPNRKERRDKNMYAVFCKGLKWKMWQRMSANESWVWSQTNQGLGCFPKESGLDFVGEWRLRKLIQMCIFEQLPCSSEKDWLKVWNAGEGSVLHSSEAGKRKCNWGVDLKNIWNFKLLLWLSEMKALKCAWLLLNKDSEYWLGTLFNGLLEK